MLFLLVCTTGNPALDYKFHIMLAAKLKEVGITPEELDKKLNKDLDSNALDRFRRSGLHQRMKVDETLKNARKKLKTRDALYPMMYLLDRWSRVYGGPRNPHVLKKIFKQYPRITDFIDKLWYVIMLVFSFQLSLKIAWESLFETINVPSPSLLM